MIKPHEVPGDRVQRLIVCCALPQDRPVESIANSSTSPPQIIAVARGEGAGNGVVDRGGKVTKSTSISKPARSACRAKSCESSLKRAPVGARRLPECAARGNIATRNRFAMSIILLDIPLDPAQRQWVVLAIGLIAVAYLMFRPRSRKKDPLAKSPAFASLSSQRSVERQMQNLLVELSEMARQIRRSWIRVRQSWSSSSRRRM